jgi:hypothetical protein
MMNRDFEMIDATFNALAERERRLGSECIDEVERVVLLLWHASGIIGNGGFRYFFECGLSLPATTEAYARTGVKPAANILGRVLDLFPAKVVPDDYDERMALVEGLYEQNAELLDHLEEEFYSTDELMEQQVAGWIRVHKDVFQINPAP